MKAIAFPTDSRLLEVARRKLVLIAQRSGVVLCRLLKRRQGVEPVIRRLKDYCGLRRNWPKGSEGDVLLPAVCAAGHKLHWLIRAVGRLGLKTLFAFCVLVGTLGRMVSRNIAWLSGGQLAAES